MRIRRLPALVALLALALALIPIFARNVIGSSDAAFFNGWDRDSEALVLANIERSAEGGQSSPWALFVAQPQIQSPYATFDDLKHGTRPAAASYIPYTSSLELQGRLFQGAYSVGCTSVGCLETLESGLFSVVLVAFAAALARVTRRSLGITVIGCTVVSPWIVASAHNLYWVPWTWLLPALAACFVPAAHSSRTRSLALACVGVGTALKAGTGYEFLTTTTLLAASVPLLAHLLGRGRARKAVASDVAAVFVVCVVAFLAVLMAHAVVSGAGSPVVGLQHIADDAMKRTYGSPELGSDDMTVQSLQVSPLAVVAIYLVGWSTSLFAIGLNGASSSLSIGPGGFWILLVAAGALPVLGAVRGQPVWRRDATLLLAGLIPAFSWWILGKSHAYTAQPVCFVLWYLILVPLMVWMLGEALARAAASFGLDPRLLRAGNRPRPNAKLMQNETSTGTSSTRIGTAPVMLPSASMRDEKTTIEVEHQATKDCISVPASRRGAWSASTPR